MHADPHQASLLACFLADAGADHVVLDLDPGSRTRDGAEGGEETPARPITDTQRIPTENYDEEEAEEWGDVLEALLDQMAYADIEGIPMRYRVGVRAPATRTGRHLVALAANSGVMHFDCSPEGGGSVLGGPEWGGGGGVLGAGELARLLTEAEVAHALKPSFFD